MPSRPTIALLSFYDLENNAVRQLAAGLRQSGWRVVEIYWQDWRNNAFDPWTPADEALLVTTLRAEGVRLLGVSLRASAYQRAARRLIGSLRERLDDLTVVLGGWHATVRPDTCLEFCDAVCVGEGDRSFPLFLERWLEGPVLSSPGFRVRGPDGQVRGEPPLPLVPLHALPRRDFTHPDKVVIHWGQTSRGDPMAKDPVFQIFCSVGCVQRCAFCHNSYEVPGQPARLRYNTVDAVLEEIAAARARNPAIRRVRFDDEIFGLDPHWLAEFSRRYPAEVGLPFDVLAEPSIVTEDYAELLSRAGECVVHLGLQSTEAVNREQLGRRADRATTRRAIERLTHRGVRLRYLVMVDIPGTTEATREELLRFLLEVPRPWDLYLFSLTWFPGTAMVEEGLAQGRLRPEEVEGTATKTFEQYRVDLAYPRPPADVRWLALLVLLSSQVVPPALVERLARVERFREDPLPLRRLAEATNLAKTAQVAVGMILHREMTWTLLQRWWAPRSTITL